MPVDARIFIILIVFKRQLIEALREEEMSSQLPGIDDPKISKSAYP